MKIILAYLLLAVAAYGDSQYLPNAVIDSPQPNDPVIGIITVSGWAIDNTTDIGSGVSLVQIAIDSQPRATVTYGISRPDVCAVYPGRLNCPNVGFTAQLDTSVVPPGGHTIHVWVTNSDTPYTSTRVFDVPINVATSFSSSFTESITAQTPGATVTDDATGGTMVLPTANAPQPQLLLSTSQDNSSISNRAVTLADSYTKQIHFAAPNSPVYMLGSQYDISGGLNAPPYNFCLTGSSYFASGAPCQVGTTDASGGFQISGSFSLISLSAPFPPQIINEQWWVGDTSDASSIGVIGYIIFPQLPSPPQ